jgi:ribonuclease-3
MNVKNLELDYKFKNIELLETAFTHLSFANEHGTQSYERLEYLGDSVLQLVVSEYLYFNFPQLTSGELSKYRSHLVSTKNLSTITKKLHFDKYIKIGKALNSVSDALMADLFESVLASIYLDGGITPAKEFVLKHVVVDDENVVNIYNQDRDYKTELQELLQSMTPQPKLEYVVVSTDMKNNKTYFTMQLLIDGKTIAEITQQSKKECEKKLSKIAFEKLSN